MIYIYSIILHWIHRGALWTHRVAYWTHRGALDTKSGALDTQSCTLDTSVAECILRVAHGVQGEIMELVAFLRNPDRFLKMGARSPAGVLLVGPPGALPARKLEAKCIACGL